eukprot:TRINITY_DN3171_c0_g1_i6.p1 TRINITY_DN3171_c0_g1~~TRINITY_DN3171_c0_g1_i6.p1  ORF type:complete len:112 (-),score=13.72 TRINITY_DN3171_c0_g1_i6:55-390(-)
MPNSLLIHMEAVTAARKNAFSRMAIILLENKKVMVYMPDSTLPESILDPSNDEDENELDEQENVFNRSDAKDKPSSKVEQKTVWAKCLLSTRSKRAIDSPNIQRPNKIPKY